MSAPGGIPKTWVILLNSGIPKVGDVAASSATRTTARSQSGLAWARVKAAEHFGLP
jgi:hypothetical protein